jgi:hypothetical protein
LEGSAWEVGVTEKKCPKCQSVKPSSDFHKNRNRGDGLNGYCRSCMRGAQHAHYLANRESYLDDQRERRSQRPDIRKARKGLEYALLMGRVQKPEACQKCGGNAKVEAHHPDYSKPLGVEWLCRSCHSKFHWDERVPA